MAGDFARAVYDASIFKEGTEAAQTESRHLTIQHVLPRRSTLGKDRSVFRGSAGVRASPRVGDDSIYQRSCRRADPIAHAEIGICTIGMLLKTLERKLEQCSNERRSGWCGDV
jgi:hypothetical protein